MTAYEHELRLLHFVIVNAIVLASAWRLVRREPETSDIVQAMLDCALVWFVVQYLSVGVPGLLGVLSSFTISTTAILLSAAMWLPFRRRSLLGREGEAPAEPNVSGAISS